MTLYNLVYISRASYPLSDQDLINILVVSRNRNASLGITGMLLCRGDVFMQVLEGEINAVRTLYYGKITLDKRHTDCHVLAEEFITERSFPKWEMGFNHVMEIDEPLKDNVIDFMANDNPYQYTMNNAGFALNLLLTFKDENMF